jgi:predicted ATP-grasp superfamily ATP-dependent carboligase
VNVLVTDAEYKLTLGVIRSLGRHGVRVVAGATTRRAEGFRSRYCAEAVVYAPHRDEERFVSDIVAIGRQREIDVVLPIGYDTTTVLARHRAALPGSLRMPLANADAIATAASKRLTLDLARTVGVPVPETYEAPEAVRAFPVVVKSALGSGAIRYVNDAAELRTVTRPDSIVQEYVPGEGRGFFALFDEGRPRAVFMHRRLREYPVTGGASTAAESIRDEALADLGQRLLGALNWHGVAMVEFKLDQRDGSYKLMEINPKFWGSLDLAIAAGVDFPWLALRLASGESFEPPRYRIGLRYQWLFSDLLHVAARPSAAGSFLRDLLDPSVASDWCWADPRPNAYEALLTAAAVVRRARSGTLRHPHGVPSQTSRLNAAKKN